MVPGRRLGGHLRVRSARRSHRRAGADRPVGVSSRIAGRVRAVMAVRGASRGVVYLVGAGPGDPRLITVAGLDAIRSSDVIVYDRLVNRALLEEAPAWAERIPVGKRPGRHAVAQALIDAILIDKAR